MNDHIVIMTIAILAIGGIAITSTDCTPAATADSVAVATDAIEQKACIDRVPVKACADAAVGIDCVEQQQIAIDKCRAEVRAHRDGGAQ